MQSIVKSVWWALALRGLAAIAFGVLAFTLPDITLASLVILFGIYAIADGAFNIVAAIRGRNVLAPRWLLAVQGVVSILAGVGAFSYPGITTLALVLLIGAWAVVSGALEVVAAFRFRKHIDNEWLLGLSGVISIFFGSTLLLRPAPGALAVVWIIGTYAIVYGAVLLGFSYRVRKNARDLTSPPVGGRIDAQRHSDRSA